MKKTYSFIENGLTDEFFYCVGDSKSNIDSLICLCCIIQNMKRLLEENKSYNLQMSEVEV